MAQLVEPDGALNLITTINAAIAFCKTHPGWSWQYIDE